MIFENLSRLIPISLSLFAILGALGFGGYYLYSNSTPAPANKKANKVSSAAPPSGARKEESGSESAADLEWIPEHLKGQKPKKRAANK
jgi:hypothetical protein